MYWTGKSMNNHLSYCGLVDPRISASDKDLPVPKINLMPSPALGDLYVVRSDLKIYAAIKKRGQKKIHK
jgi:hypothetical protein